MEQVNDDTPGKTGRKGVKELKEVKVLVLALTLG